MRRRIFKILFSAESRFWKQRRDFLLLRNARQEILNTARVDIPAGHQPTAAPGTV